MVEAPHRTDARLYCIECYTELFPPGWTDEYQPLKDIDMSAHPDQSQDEKDT